MAEPARWSVRSYSQIPREEIRLHERRNAILSRVESGSIYATPYPARSFIRGAVYDDRGLLMPTSQRVGGADGDLVLSTNPPALTTRERNEAQARNKSGKWLYVGHWMHGFGHFLVETLPTFWPLLDGDDSYNGICAHSFTSQKSKTWQFELIRFLTDAPVEIVTDTPCTVEELDVADRPYHYQHSISPLAATVWDLVSIRAAKQGDPDGEPIYLSRSRFDAASMSNGVKSGREFPNGEEVDALFERAGFRVIHPEELSVLQQIQIVRSAPIIAGQSGSALHLTVFAKPGARVIEVCDSRTARMTMATQYAISSAKRQLLAQVPYKAHHNGDLDLVALEGHLFDLRNL